MSNFTNFFSETLPTFVGSGIAVAVLGFLASAIIKHRLSRQLESHKVALSVETAKQLELLKSELSRQVSRETELLRSSLEILSHKRKMTQEQIWQHRSRALDQTYSALQEIREQFRTFVGRLGTPLHEDNVLGEQDSITNKASEALAPLLEEALYFEYEAHRELLQLWRKVPNSLTHDFLDLSLARSSLHKDGEPSLHEIKERSEKFAESSAFVELSARLEATYRTVFSKSTTERSV